ncbi:Rrf2 family transcriptional regulator [Collinsella sp. An2]|uniref:RrF2 family transcriptional regulator n=1 Tax=Collinsella sp. An2 TaxID=1965585 RepID=UPI000B382878|nr:Rrf2 family transcriptional regulator [Collinsella sp. An2]OUP09196.1 Rrf2 family transcriptional regulator [Collinsella sp. An2]
MLVSTKGRYALRVLVDLARHQGSGRVPLKEVAERQGISEKYLENILSVLVRSGMLSGMRGKGGGYRLTREPELYTVGEVLRLTEGTIAPVSCLEKDCLTCGRLQNCPTHPMWVELDRRISGYLDNVTVADLCKAPEAQL